MINDRQSKSRGEIHLVGDRQPSKEEEKEIVRLDDSFFNDRVITVFIQMPESVDG